MRGRLVLPAAMVAVAGAAVATFVPAHAAPAPRGAACQIAGSATISPGLTQTARPQRITLSGVHLTNCHEGSAGAPGVPKAFTGTVTTSPNPLSATASCVSGNLVLNGAIRWSTGKTTNVAVTTKGVTANQAITGHATSSTDPAIKAGDLVGGDVAFKPTTTAQNCAKVAVTAVTFTGAIGVGSPK